MSALENPQRDADLVRGVLDLTVLALLATAPDHAYAVVDRLRTAGLTQAGYGTIYPLVTRLRRQGLLAQTTEPSPEGPRRNVLTVTPAGTQALREWRTRWERTNAVVSSVLATFDDQGSASRV